MAAPSHDSSATIAPCGRAERGIAMCDSEGPGLKTVGRSQMPIGSNGTRLRQGTLTRRGWLRRCAPATVAVAAGATVLEAEPANAATERHGPVRLVSSGKSGAVAMDASSETWVQITL